MCGCCTDVELGVGCDGVDGAVVVGEGAFCEGGEHGVGVGVGGAVGLETENKVSHFHVVGIDDFGVGTYFGEAMEVNGVVESGD